MRLARWLITSISWLSMLGLAAATPALAAEFKPNGPVTIVAPFAAGGTVDQVAREQQFRHENGQNAALQGGER